jgi:hypothetical protein
MTTHVMAKSMLAIKTCNKNMVSRKDISKHFLDFKQEGIVLLPS